MLNKIKAEIEKLLITKEHIFVAIDGRCGAGKSTIAKDLGYTVLHMDDFFLRPCQRTEERLSETGGNVDYERFFSEVLLPLKEKGMAEYRRFDCKTMTLCKAQTITRDRVTVVEGAYSLHPYFGDIYDLKIFVTTSYENQLKRISQRNGFLLSRFENRWIPMEEKYISTFAVKEKCDIIIET